MAKKEYPYYKVQYFDQILLTWHVIEKETFDTDQEAIDYGRTLKKTFRVQEVNADSRKIISTHRYDMQWR